MEELVNKLNQIPDSYFGFIAGVITYVKRKPERLEKVMHFLDTSKTLTTSDILEFIADQPDFHEFGLGFKKNDENNETSLV
ncbi:MAG: hypothetical protein IJK13_04345 [Lachnospiraceae bacterium]|nr:hypothetical protein [Lachnospiraceae bacterium]